MDPNDVRCCTAFDGHRLIASGDLAGVVAAAKQVVDAGAAGPLLIFDDQSSRQLEFDFRGTLQDVLARLSTPAAGIESPVRGPGRPKLGVVAREVTLLPRHWAWLAAQPGGASATLRRLIEDARRQHGGRERARLAGEAVDRFMLAMTGDLPGHEEATRAFWRHDRELFMRWTEAWPTDVREHVRRLASQAWDDGSAS
ncbi:DUF2239 family protein [Dyella soli]|uniref:DUF2239 family protein n=1 Tax=Dyella soli TaxID=522319 RepID=A0A4R0YKG2_9GAMM|nr:DUF2239 family protein [Dyella soli]TCI09019.1 DUF2239 family protein [Dyella soli]